MLCGELNFRIVGFFLGGAQYKEKLSSKQNNYVYILSRIACNPLKKKINFLKEMITVEINKGQPNENKQRLFIPSLLWQGSQSLSLAFGGDSKQAEEWERFINDKRESARCALMGGCLHGEMVSRQTGSSVSYGTG